jgi:glycosyltransferase involved in cell wall biosynthesis
MLKALAYGCAICALDTVFNREMLNNDEYGLFFSKQKGNLESLIHSIEESPGQLLVYQQKSRRRITENYTWEKITDQYDVLFKSMNTDER